MHTTQEITKHIHHMKVYTTSGTTLTVSYAKCLLLADGWAAADTELVIAIDHGRRKESF